MSLLSHINLAYPFSGFCIGALVGLTGVGGGSLMTPVLVLLFGIHPATAVGTDLLYASITKSGGTIVHSINKSVDWGIVARLAGGSIPGAAMTLFILNSLGAATQRTGSIISIILGIVLILTALSLFFHRHILDFASNRLGEISPQRAALLTVVTGTILGILVSMSSVGAGALGVTALICLYPKLPLSKIVGSDIAHAVPLTLIAGLGHWFMGAVNLAVVGSLLTGSIPGIVIGSYLAPRVPERLLRPLLATTLVIVGTKLVF